MPLDTSEVGIVAAKVMEDLEQADTRGEYGDDAQVLAAVVIYEVRDDEGLSTVGLRVTDDRNVIGLGLLERAREALLNPDGDLADND